MQTMQMDIEKKLNSKTKPTILIFTGNYLPGWKAGGILRTIVNTIDQLSEDFNFKVVTRDRDLGDTNRYPNIQVEKWLSVGDASVYYLENKSLKIISEIIKTENCDVIFLNSFFDIFTIKVLLCKKLNFIQKKPIIVSPRGEFAWASLKLKYPKKYIFIKVIKLIGLYKNVTWHASSKYEAQDISKVMNIKLETIKLALDLPTRFDIDKPQSITSKGKENFAVLKIIFLSRISREKNLDYALNILSEVKSDVIFDVYGPPEDLKYFEECKKLASLLPTNVKCNFFKAVHPEKVQEVFCNYDLFLFPTGGENYGHVIAESLSAGTPVLISDKTPWRDLEKGGLGWDFNLDNKKAFVEVIEKFASTDGFAKEKSRDAIKLKATEKLSDSKLIEQNKKLFTDLIA